MTTYLMDGYQQSDDPNKNWKKLALYIFIIIAACVIASFLGGCSAAKQMERHEQAVLNNPQSEKKIGLKYMENNPCANQTITVHDSIVNEKTKYIHSTDTVMKGDTIYIFTTDTAYFQKTVYRDSTIVDKQREKMLSDSINILLQQKAALNQNVIDSHDATQTEKKDKDKWLWMFIAACAAFTLTNGLWIYGKIKSGNISGILSKLKP